MPSTTLNDHLREQLADLKAKGQTGQLGLDLSRAQDLNSVGSAG